jgi:hypothetical protein
LRCELAPTVNVHPSPSGVPVLRTLRRRSGSYASIAGSDKIDKKTDMLFIDNEHLERVR